MKWLRDWRKGIKSELEMIHKDFSIIKLKRHLRSKIFVKFGNTVEEHEKSCQTLRIGKFQANTNQGFKEINKIFSYFYFYLSLKLILFYLELFFFFFTIFFVRLKPLLIVMHFFFQFNSISIHSLRCLK